MGSPCTAKTPWKGTTRPRRGYSAPSGARGHPPTAAGPFQEPTRHERSDMNSEDVILISVDDHIAEPSDMFDAHVPAKCKDLAPRVETDDRGIQQWWYGDLKGRNLGLNAVAGKPPEMYNIDPSRYDEMRPGCFDFHERVRDMNAGCHAVTF
jgi:hypothetical protein